jgi:hypothetical protein
MLWHQLCPSQLLHILLDVSHGGTGSYVIHMAATMASVCYMQLLAL